MAEFGFHHAGVSVPSLDEAIVWYCSILGFELEKHFFVDAARAKTAMVKKGTLRFEIFEVSGAADLPEDRRTPAADLRTHGNKHVAFGVPDLEGFLAEMQSKGADIAFVVRETFGKSCFVRDCAGNLIEFVEQEAS